MYRYKLRTIVNSCSQDDMIISYTLLRKGQNVLYKNIIDHEKYHFMQSWRYVLFENIFFIL